jgi:ribonuclease-3
MRQLPLDIHQLETNLGYTFQNRALLLEALTHSTYAYEHRQDVLISNERLEFLGDAVLDLAVGDVLFRLSEQQTEGFMTKTRALVVCENTLAIIARKLEIGRLLFLGKGEEATGGSEKPSNLANAMEALFGAIYLDADFAQARQVIISLLAEPIREAIAGSINYDYKSRLLELVQAQPATAPLQFTILEERGPVHERIFTAGVLLGDILIGKGQGNSKKDAEQQAARLALDWFAIRDENLDVADLT